MKALTIALILVYFAIGFAIDVWFIKSGRMGKVKRDYEFGSNITPLDIIFLIFFLWILFIIRQNVIKFVKFVNEYNYKEREE